MTSADPPVFRAQQAMAQMETSVFTFDTTHHALWAEQIALDLKLAVQVIPAPADSGAKCDLALEVLQEDSAALRKALVEQRVQFRLYPPREPGQAPGSR